MAWPKGRPRAKKVAEPSGEGVPGPAEAGERFVDFAESMAGNPFDSDKAAPERIAALTKAKPTPRFSMKARPEGFDNAVMPAEESTDRFFIAKEDFPEDYDLQWVTHSVVGMEMPQERRKFENRQWTPVHQEDFGRIYDGRWMPKGAAGEINVDGLVLMARPMRYSIEARQKELRAAREQVQIKEQAWRSGDINATGAREQSALRTNRISKSYERLDVPE